jgi:hypothetical protein
MNSLKQEVEFCTKLLVDPSKIKVSKSECEKIKNKHQISQLDNY